MDYLLGDFAGKEFPVEVEKLNIIEQHTAQFGKWEPNEAMLARLKTAIAEGRNISGADASFYFHELKEAELMQTGLDYAEAHVRALAEYNVSPYSVYHPEVIEAFPDEFNNNWHNAWRINQSNHHA